jgi:sulfoxide reductase heme-binding subunit YedZ
MNALLRSLIGMSRKRWLTHGTLLLITLVSIFAIQSLYLPTAAFGFVLTIATAYISLALIVLTLLIGPFKLMVQRRNPVNIDLRRNVGIWAAFNGIVHVIFGLQVHDRVGVIGYFLRQTAEGYTLLTNRFGIANWVGLVATVILLVLLFTSNDLSLRRLKGRRWKALQRWNYGLAGLTLLHTFLYQVVSGRERDFVTFTLLLTLVLLAGQFMGIQLYRASRNRRRIKSALQSE